MEFRNSDSDNSKLAKGHVVLISYPTQGHVSPFMKLAHRLADFGLKVTFVTTEFIHEKLMKSLQPRIVSSLADLENCETLSEICRNQVNIVPLPDGLDPEDDRKDEKKLSESIFRVMPGYLEGLIKEVNGKESGNDPKITCVIADSILGWALEVADKLGLKKVIFFTSAPGILAMTLKIPSLITARIIDTDGTAIKNGKIELTPNLPLLSPTEFTWSYPGNPFLQKIAFQYICTVSQNVTASDWILCNWFHQLDPVANDFRPNILQIGPLLSNNHSFGSFWSEDLTGLSWLDKHPPKSVIYVAFGSSSMFTQEQFDELAHGLELLDQPFLLVVRQGFVTSESIRYPDGFTEKLASIGKIVEWAPQEKVLAHPSIACYITHCGWNSTLEGLANGVPLLCWPYFADQFYIKSCVCESWKAGLGLKQGENGIVTRDEIKEKLEELLSSDVIRDNVLKLKELANESYGSGGSSFKNLEYFINQIKV